jgi:two-component system OmpR family sensor kinase
LNAGADHLLLRRARRSLAMLNIVTVALVLLLFAGVVGWTLAVSQRNDLRRSLSQTAATQEDVDDPPADSWIFILGPDGSLAASHGAPAGFPDRAALQRVRAGRAAETRAVDIGGTDYLIVTEARDQRVVQVVGSLAAEEGQRHRLLAALGVAALVGLTAAGAAGTLLARRATAPLGEALNRQRRFVADASHELRTPVTQLHTRAQLLRRDLRTGSGTATVTADVDQLVAGTRRLGELIDDLLLSTQLPNRSAEAPEVDLGVLAAGVTSDLAVRALEQGTELVLRPDPDGPALVRGREAALRRVIVALADNALSHTPAGGHVTVELHAVDKDRMVTLTVRDDGTGFDPADTERIFDRFARGHGDPRRFGLGLALAREVVTGHGGTIRATGTPGQGAAFIIRLPAAAS